MVKRKTQLRLFAISSLLLLLFVSTWDTAAAADAVVLAQTDGGVTVRSARSYVVETAVVVLLFGGALFAVCRSSRRS